MIKQKDVVDTVMRGGDTDTNAAICGALLGACTAWKPFRSNGWMPWKIAGLKKRRGTVLYSMTVAC